MNHISLPAQPALLGFAEGVWNPEDLVRLDGTPWIVVSALRAGRGRGALLAVDAGATRPGFEIPWRPEAEVARRSAEAFDPHGIDARPVGDGRFELLVIDHGAGEAIERLWIDVGVEGPQIVRGERLAQPPGTSGNAVAFAPGGFVFTSMFDPGDADFVGKFAAADPTGGVWRWSGPGDWRRVGPQLSGANGVAVGPDGAIFVSEWAAQRLWRLSPDGDVTGRVDVDFLPDNLRWAAGHRLLLAGQTTRPEVLFGCAPGDPACPMGYKVVGVDPRDLSVSGLLDVSDGQARTDGFGGATGALEVDGDLWVASFTGERIARFGPAATRSGP